MPIPSAEKEKLRHEMRKMLNRKNNKNRLHKIQKNVQVYDIGMPLLAALERKLDIQLDSIRRGFCLNEVRLSAKRANNKANKYGFPDEPEKMSMTAMMSMPDSALSMDMENGKSKGDKPIFRQRLTHEQVDRMQKIAEDAEWSLLKIPRATRETIAAEVGVSIDQFKNFFSNAKPKDKKKMLPRKDGNPEVGSTTPTGAAAAAAAASEKQLVYRQRLSVWQINELTTAAIGVDWSLINMSKAGREALSNKVGITVDQLKNFFSNAKPKELKRHK